MKRLLLSATALLPAILLAAPLHAQDASASRRSSEGGIEDIVVTAQRRTESMQKVPIAVTAFSQDQLRAQGVSSTVELGRFVPNLLSMNNTGIGTANAFYLRGLGNTESIATFDPPVGTYVDDIYLSRQNANNINLFDVERVEVLRGPQGTLFGRNTTGGAINVIMRQPGDSFGGYAEVGYGSNNKKVVRGSADVPLADTLAIKISGYWQNDDGYVKNVTTGDRLNDDDGWGVRLGIRGELSDHIHWTGSFAHIVANGENILNFTCNPVNPSQCDGRYATTGLKAGRNSPNSPFASLAISGRKKYYLLGNYTQSNLVTSNLAIDLSDTTKVSLITGFVTQAQQYGLDFYDGRSGPSLANPVPPVMGYARGGFVYLNDSKHEQISQEVKINGSFANDTVEYVAGLFYLHENNTTDFADLLTISPTTTLILGDRTLRNQTRALAGYAQADFNVTSQLKLTAGIRYTDEQKTMSIRDNRPVCNNGPLLATCLDNSNLFAPSGRPIPTKLTARVWTPRFAVNFNATDDVLLFASATRGFKSGGWNARVTAPSAFIPFNPEKVWSYEAGIKSEWFDHRVRANLTAFYLTVRDLQTPSALVAPNGSASFITRNFANLKNKGLEAEFIFAPTAGLNLYVNAGFQDARLEVDRSAPDYDEYGIQSVNAQQKACKALLAAGYIPGGPGTTVCAAGIVTPGGNIAIPTRTPKLTLAFGGSYEVPIGDKLSLTPSVNVSYRSDQESGTANYTIYSGAISGTNGSFPANPFGGPTILTGSFAPAVWFVNAGLSLNGPEKMWQLSVNCTNCFNKYTTTSSLVNTRYFDPPRRWMANLRYRF